jgi:hypothetical protein
MIKMSDTRKPQGAGSEQKGCTQILYRLTAKPPMASQENGKTAEKLLY